MSRQRSETPEERFARIEARAARAAEALGAFLEGRPLRNALVAESRRSQLEVEARPPSPHSPAVIYLLVDPSGHVLYVGCSRSWPARARRHLTSWIGQVTDHVRIIPASPSWDPLSLEDALIEALQPPYNTVGTSHGLNLPSTSDDILRGYLNSYRAESTIAQCEAKRLAWQGTRAPAFPVTADEKDRAA